MATAAGVCDGRRRVTRSDLPQGGERTTTRRGYINQVKPGVFGAVRGQNTLVVHDVAGNTTTVAFSLN